MCASTGHLHPKRARSTPLELHGAYGYMRDGGFEKLVRDAACFIHSDGVNRTLLLKAAQTIRATAP
jgi:alkylation response protein AidB-like acyl-CoA dehydrogenase